MYEFQKKMKDWGVDTLDDPNLDDDFVTESKEFLEKVENKELDEKQIKEQDANLAELFEDRHDKEDIDDEEMKEKKEELDKEKGKNKDLFEKHQAEKKKNLINQARIDSKTGQLETLEKLKSTYKEEPEALKIIEDKIAWIKEHKEKNQQKKKGGETDEQLKKRRIEGLKKLADMKGYYANYDDLKRIGINPTGDNMEIEGYRLQRQFSFLVYKIVAPASKEKKEKEKEKKEVKKE